MTTHNLSLSLSNKQCDIPLMRVETAKTAIQCMYDIDSHATHVMALSSETLKSLGPSAM